MAEKNVTVLHKISAVVGEIDAGATATADFMDDYGWYVLISVLGCFALCVISTCYGYCKSMGRCCYDVVWCLTCRCCFRRGHARLRGEDIL